MNLEVAMEIVACWLRGEPVIETQFKDALNRLYTEVAGSAASEDWADLYRQWRP